MEPTQAIAPAGQTALDKLLADPSQLKDYPIETVERLFSMHKELQQEAARRAFNEAFNRVQKKMTPVVKKGRNKQTGSFYARAQEVSEHDGPPDPGRGGISRGLFRWTSARPTITTATS